MINILLILAIYLVVSFIFSEIFFRLKYPRVIGYILAGIFLGYPFFSGLFFPEGNFSLALGRNDPSAMAIDLLSNLGIIFLLLLTGLEINIEKLRKCSREVILIAFFAALVPFLLGFFLMLFLGQSLLVAFIVGAALALTAEGTKDMVLMELRKVNSRVGEIMIGAGAVDDVFGTLFLAVILIIAKTQALGFSEVSELFLLLIDFLAFVVLSYLIFKILPSLVRFIQKEKSEVSEFTIIIIIGLLIAIISEKLGLGTIIGALIAGIILQLAIKDIKEEKKMVKDLKIITLGLVIPFFFISVGLKFWSFEIQQFLLNDLLLFVLIILIATVGKIFGSLIVKPLTSLSLKQLYLIGWGMNSRGAIELVIAMVAYPFIPGKIFSAIVVMAIFTTLIFPVFLRRYIKKYPDIMD